ncbi:phenylacetate--CoA ligase family protein [Ramlibacter alkalitolerans]|uniref:Phenylacetate-coenzyme A ligase n=1 Tax=Ramlibacter alkalitolerans TaxID=2039631 RepID=A0ABS1JHD8_9BURK|nr:phenylacetate--CoA ligase [Ramlibacter alkalitolerans]MBL0423638.1 phenylacetate--CoA ligase [Ramlibacter alkalitolerans]
MAAVIRPIETSAPARHLHPELETMPREQLRALQLRRLRDTIENAYENVPTLRRRLQSARVRGNDLHFVEDVARLPFTLKSDLRDNYPFGLFARPVGELARLHASSGTTGKSTVVGYTAQDLDQWADLMARSYFAAGARRGDIVHNAYGYGLFTGGLGAHYGAERLGAVVVPVSGGATERQVTLMQDFGATVLCSTPSYALAIAEAAEQQGIDLRMGKLRVGLFGAEPWSAAMRVEIEARLGLKAMDVYGLSEIMGPGVACECECRAGLHGWEDHFLFEVIDPETGAPVPEGHAGELVITTLTKQALPMIRYRTRDITRITTAPCDCGRTHLRILRITGRNDDMLIIRGVNVYPSQVEAVIVGRPQLAPHYQLVVTREGILDEVRIEVEAQPGVDRATYTGMARELAHAVKVQCGISSAVTILDAGSVARSQGKAVRVRDLRKKEA